ncbi:MAG: SLBB domain-containing protein [Ignavibacteriaceae bacterium]|nr:SLBB domain-containing protein [Ignavibacteriaceae bacterium]
MRKLFVLFTVLLISTSLYSQNENVQIGSPFKDIRNQQTAVYDLSDPNGINIKVSVWGYVGKPGKYIVPINTNLLDILTYAGGPTTDATVEDLRLFRTMPDSTQQLLTFNYNSLMWEEKFTQNLKFPKLEPDDLILVTGEPRFFFKDYFSITLSIISTLVSLTILIINIARN